MLHFCSDMIILVSFHNKIVYCGEPHTISTLVDCDVCDHQKFLSSADTWDITYLKLILSCISNPYFLHSDK